MTAPRDRRGRASDETWAYDRGDDPGDADRGPVVNTGKLWAGGLATAVVAALVALVGVLIVRAILPSSRGFDNDDAVLLCLLAAAAALAATGLAHLLLVSTPRPLAYLGWIIGLVTAAAVVLPFTGGAPVPVKIATAVIHLVIGVAIGSLVTGAAAAAVRRPPRY
ncbi:DUF6069 family protein [Pseudonocardia sp.]|uniref:DUF6069 family protein n=1 Tax=Pseudonocardia sp. TaxID=60912 RepID=UPI003D0CC110